jgi:hypothetical protein
LETGCCFGKLEKRMNNGDPHISGFEEQITSEKMRNLKK